MRAAATKRFETKDFQICGCETTRSLSFSFSFLFFLLQKYLVVFGKYRAIDTNASIIFSLSFQDSRGGGGKWAKISRTGVKGKFHPPLTFKKRKKGILTTNFIDQIRRTLYFPTKMTSFFWGPEGEKGAKKKRRFHIILSTPKIGRTGW